ncbi:hypothetical protein AB0I98_48815 [Streptomyces sp. NPDC050211]|uniref:hypothetical protein n=1 Tax=Streptomyces sp. NPDC050211 TaxID=3154932 RepID=UPI00343F18CF
MLEAIIAAAAGVLGAGIGAWAALRARKAPEAKVEFVDVAVVPLEDLEGLLEGGSSLKGVGPVKCRACLVIPAPDPVEGMPE